MEAYYCKKIIFFLFCITIIFSISKISAAGLENEMKTLLMFFKEEDLVITPTRHPKPVLQTAENISIITAEEIEMMNAHTLKDVLYNVPGVQVDLRGGPGSASLAHIQGSEFNHVLVMIDGITLNNLTDNAADIAAIPVQNIQRVEIIKGPASSSWGSSLGGIVNVITKPAGYAQEVKGVLYGSHGEKNTGDYRAEVSAGNGDAGYYIYAGSIDSDGLTANTPYDQESFYTKLGWNAMERGRLLFTFFSNKGSRGMGEYPVWDMSFKNDFEYLSSSLSFDYKINDESDLNLSFRASGHDAEQIINLISTGVEAERTSLDESNFGGSASFIWRHGKHNIIFGMDLDKSKLRSKTVIGGMQEQEKWAVYTNDTILVNRLSIIPGIRFDHINTNNDFLSPSMGMTYRISEKTIFRGYAACGFNVPLLSSIYGAGPFYAPNPDLKVEKIWSIQGGIETTSLRYLWIKTAFFQHNTWDAISTEELLDPNGMPAGMFTDINQERQRRQGIEVEIKTISFYNTSFFAGLFIVDAKDRHTGERLKDIPRYTYDIGIHYHHPKIFDVYAKGRYIWWNASHNGEYNDFIWDINIMKKFYRQGRRDLYAFLTVHNIFNSPQYLVAHFRNPPRWIEGGIRLEF